MKLRTWCIRISQFLTKTGSGLRGALLVLLVCGLSSAAFAEQGITIKQQNVSLEKIFASIEKQSGYRFFYNESLLNGTIKVSIDLRNGSIHEALEICFKGQPLTYSIVDKTVVVKRREGAVRAVILNKVIAVRGKVTNGKTPVADATVAVKGTNNMTSTDVDGIFTLSEVDDQSVLVITHVSHERREVRLEGKAFISIDMTEKVGDLDEAVVVAYNTTTQRRNTGSVSVVKGEEIQNLPNRSFDKSLQGLVPGLLVTSGTGQPGGGLGNFVLRGIATGNITDASSTIRNPLIVVDGVPVTQDHTQWEQSLTDAPVMNPMAQLNPADIESVSVLKDAAAISLYGAKASNGVILITTKMGKTGKTRFTLNHQTDLSSRLKGKVELLNEKEFYDLLYDTYKTTDPVLWTDSAIVADLKSKFPTRADGSFYPVTNWPNEVYTDNAVTISNNFSISGGNEKSRFYLNLEWTKQDGVFKGTGYDRKSVRFNFENKPYEWLKFGINTGLSYNRQNYASLSGGTFPLGVATYLSPLNPTRTEDGNLVLNYSFPYSVASPLAAIEYNTNRNISYRGLSKFYGELSFLKYFKFASNLGVDFMLTEAKEKVDPRLFDYSTKSLGGRIQEQDSRNANLITTNIFRFDRTFQENHSVHLLLGQEAQILTNKTLMLSVGNTKSPDYDQINNGSTVLNRGGIATKETLLSYFGQLNYDFRNKYLLSASLRRDGSSRYGEREKFGTYWSTGIGWLVTSEQFMQPLSPWLNYFKIRGSIGAAGNTAAINRLTRFDQLFRANYGNSTAVYPNVPANLNIKWEQTFTWDAGIEARLLNERVAVTADIYNRKTSDLIYLTNLAPISGYGVILDNIGDMKNNGVEVSLAVDIIKNTVWQWNLNANWSSNKNVLVKADIPLSAIGGSALANEEGRNFNSFYLAKWAGVNPSNGLPQWIDSTGKPNTEFQAAKPEFVGKPQPDGFGSVTNTVSYKNFEISAQFYYQYGFQIYNSYALTGRDGFLPYDNSDKSALNYWKKPGDIAANPKRSLNNTNGVFQYSTRHLFDGDFIRLQTVSFGYQIPRRIVDKLGFSMIKVYAQGHNLAIWTKFPGADPSDANVYGGVEVSYPNQRNISFGLNANF